MDGIIYKDLALTQVLIAGDIVSTSMIYFRPTVNWNGITNFKYSAVDNEGNIDISPATGTITVIAVADTPDVLIHMTENGMVASATNLFSANFNSGGLTGWSANALHGNSFAELPGGNGKTSTEVQLFNSVAWAGQTGTNTTEDTNFSNKWLTRANTAESADGSVFAVYNQGGTSGSDDAQGFLQYTGASLTTTEKNSTSYVISVQMFADASSTQANGIGFVFGYVDDNNYFLARWENPSAEYSPLGSLFNQYPGQYQELSLVQIVGGVPVDLARAAFAGDDWFNLNIAVSADGISVKAVDITSSVTTSLNYTYGTVSGAAATAPALKEVGFYTFDNDSAVRFDNLSINTGIYNYTLHTEAYLADTDGSETLSNITLSNIPAGLTLVDAVTGLAIAVNGGTTTVIAGHDITITSATALTDLQMNSIQASVTATETSNGSTATDTDSTKIDILGTVAGEALNGTAANEWLDGKAGSDTINAGAGNDTLVTDLTTSGPSINGDVGLGKLDGGTGIDTLILSTTNGSIDFSLLDGTNEPIKNMEIIDLNPNGNHSLTNLSLQDIINMTDSTTHDLTIIGKSSDTVSFQNTTGATWSKVAGTGADAGFDLYTNSGDSTVLVKVEQAITDQVL
jgi:hypothetical protein